MYVSFFLSLFSLLMLISQTGCELRLSQSLRRLRTQSGQDRQGGHERSVPEQLEPWPLPVSVTSVLRSGSSPSHSLYHLQGLHTPLFISHFCRDCVHLSLYQTSAGTAYTSLYITCRDCVHLSLYHLQGLRTPLFISPAGTAYTSLYITCRDCVHLSLYHLQGLRTPLFISPAGTAYTSLYITCRDCVHVHTAGPGEACWGPDQRSGAQRGQGPY